MRLVIPWIAGVFCGERFFSCSTELIWGILAFGFLFALSFILYFLERYSLRWCFGVVIAALCFTGGWFGIICQFQQTIYTFPQGEVVYRVLITDTPQAKERTYLCRTLLKEHCDSVGIHPIDRNAILYLKRDSAAAQLKTGDELLVSARISPPTNNKNFDEFDYAR